ncbi:hypothetical protein HPB50_012912 [Hyalomma asiaticum]|uniref:Uncharacterized protein n=1 Tax=Hyalomma asiaticum TaxID=266040 RepID=A0ACB7SY08_HYAAI|nr:hypothetical protein HPB50_012912 [Hyalomma asiaticum]
MLSLRRLACARLQARALQRNADHCFHRRAPAAHRHGVNRRRSHLNRKCSKLPKNLHQPPDATRPVAAAAAAAHSPLETVPPLFLHSKPATARTTAVTGPDLAPGAQDPAQLIAEAADLAHTHVDRDPVEPYEPLQDPVRLARAPEQYLRR